MKKSKIYTVIGTRPQYMKIDKDLPNQYIIDTNQHYDYEMSQSFFKELKLPKPYLNLNCKSDRAGAMYDKLVKLFKKDKPDLVLVYGDTISTLMGGLAAKRCNITLAHVEAGCRSGDLSMPEELNRIIVDGISDIRFACTRNDFKNLYDERLLKTTDMYLHGDPMYDAMNQFLPLKRTKDYHKYILVTIHRDFNTDNLDRLWNIMRGLENYKKLVIPAHPRLIKALKKIKYQGEIIKPVSYKKMLELESNAWKIVTDSGGVQREAYWMRIPCIVLRDNTEWKHTVNDGWATLVGSDTNKIKDAIKNFNPAPSNNQNELPKFGVHDKIRKQLAKFI